MTSAMSLSGFRSMLDLAIVEHSGKHDALPLAFVMHPRVIDALFTEIGEYLRLADAQGCTYYNGVALVGDPLSKYPQMVTADGKAIAL
jgi:hypothetical protein